jgi:hypothetical protein
MELSDFTRDDHRRAFQDYVETAWFARTAKADFFHFGVVITLFDEVTLKPVAQSPSFTPAEARVIAMEMLSAADSLEALPPREDPTSD